MFLIGLLAWILPLFGIPLLACGAYLGWWAPLPALGVAGIAWMLARKNGRSVLGRLFRGLFAVPVLFLLGLSFSVIYFGLASAGLRIALATCVALVGGGWVFLSLRRPALVKKLHGPLAQNASPLFLLSLAFVVILPFFAWGATAESSDTFLKRELQESSLEPKGEIFELSSSPRGFAALMRSSRYLFRASRSGEAADIYVVRIRHDRAGVPVALDGVYNLTDTAAIDETDLQVKGAWAAWRVGTSDTLEQLEVANMSGEAAVAGGGWGLLGEIQRAITNLQETGQIAGVGRTTMHLSHPDPHGKFHLEFGEIVISAHGQQMEWPLGGTTESPDHGEALLIEAVPPPRPGDLTTWAVDRVRGISWIGSNGLQWIKAVVFRISSQADDLRQELVPEDPQAAVDAELGDVWARLPVVEESEMSDWPPAAIVPKLKEPLPGEGVWIDMSYEPAFSGLESRAMLFTFIRVDRKRPHNQVSIALWDPRRIDLHIVAGTEEPRSTLGQRGTGLIPREPLVMKRLVGAFNGAFQAVHGEFGMMEARVVQLPPKPYAATIATQESGTTRLGTWPSTPIPIPADMVSLRQNMTPLVAEGKPNPYKRHWWGGVPEGWTDDTRTVRSAICRTKEGFLAYFYSPGIDPEQLVDALMMTRCDYGIHLDMNGGHAGFELYRAAPADELPALSRPLDSMWEASGPVPGLPGFEFNSRLLVRKMPLMNFPRYIQTTPRDFFYLTERALLPGESFLKDPQAQEVTWKALAIPGNEFPHAIMTTNWSPANESPVRVLRIDPKQLVLLQNVESTKDAAAAQDTAAPQVTALIGFGQAKDKALPEAGSPVAGSTVITPPVTPDAEEKPLSLYFLAQKFVLTADLPERGTRLLKSSPEGRIALCVDEEGLLTVFGPFPKVLADLPFEASCASVAWLPGIDSITIGESVSESQTSFKRGPNFRAERLYPETPIVPPTTWGIPQSKPASLVAN